MATQDDSFAKKIWCDVQQRVSGILEFFGFLFYLIFRMRRLWLALGGAAIGLGLARCLAPPHHLHAGCLLSAGGAIIGFFGPRTAK